MGPVPPPYGGITHWMRLIIAFAQARSDVEISVVDTSPRWRAIYNNQIWKRVFGGAVQFVMDVYRISFVLSGRRADAIHLTTSGQLAVLRDVVVVHLAALFSVPVTYHIHFGRIPEIAAINSVEWRMLALAMKRAETVVAIDRSTYETIKRVLPLADIRLVPNFVDISILPAASSTEFAERTAIFIGWVIPTKGVAELVEAWTRINLDGWRLRIVGPCNPSYRQELIERFSPTNLDFVGELPHQAAMNMLAACELFVLPSYTEGFPNAVLEAMALGKAIVTTDVGAIPEMLDGGCGVMVKPRDSSHLADAIRTVCTSAELRLDMGVRAKERVLRNYSVNVVFEELVALWRKGL